MKIDGPILVQHPQNPLWWILDKDFYYMEDGEQQKIPRGFVFDFASIPRIFWRFISPTELGDTGPLKHDWKFRNGLTSQEKADRIFLIDMLLDSIPVWKALTAYIMVRKFGYRSWGSGQVTIVEVDDAK
jgi:hypothetical protein